MKKKKRPNRKITDKQVNQYYNYGWSDRKIAIKFKMNSSNIKERRYKLGLKAHSHSKLTKKDMKEKYFKVLMRAKKNTIARQLIAKMLKKKYPKIYKKVEKEIRKKMIIR